VTAATGDARVTHGVTHEALSASPAIGPVNCTDAAERGRVTKVTHARGVSSSHPLKKKGEGARGKRLPPPASPASPVLDPTEWLLELLDLVGAEPKGAPLRQCPAHLDGTPSLSIKGTPDGRCLLHCFAGCRTEDVLASLGMSWRHLLGEPWLSPKRHLSITRPRLAFPPLTPRTGPASSRGLRLEAVHLYGTGWVLERYRHPVTGAKDLRWLTVRDGATVPGLLGLPLSDLPLYEEVQVRQAVGAQEPVVVCESESSVDALCSAGIYGTTWAGGASVPNLTRLATVLRGARVLLVPDHDEPGLECADRIRAALEGVALQLATVLPSPSQDARDLLTERGPAAFALPSAGTAR
jgi:hypothetical protein